MRRSIRIISILLVLTLLAPPVTVFARDRGETIGLLIGAAILGAALSDNDGDRHYRRSSRYSGSSYGYSPYRSSRHHAPPSDLYRYNSGVGYDRFGYYDYDTARFGSGYYNTPVYSRGVDRYGRYCR